MDVYIYFLASGARKGLFKNILSLKFVFCSSHPFVRAKTLKINIGLFFVELNKTFRIFYSKNFGPEYYFLWISNGVISKGL